MCGTYSLTKFANFLIVSCVEIVTTFEPKVVHTIVAQKAAVKYARRQSAEAYCLHILYKLHKVGNLIWPNLA